MVKELHHHSKMHASLVKTLSKEVVGLREKQAERKLLKLHRQQLFAKYKALKGSAKTRETELQAEVTSAKHALRDGLAAKESACAGRLGADAPAPPRVALAAAVPSSGAASSPMMSRVRCPHWPCG